MKFLNTLILDKIINYLELNHKLKVMAIIIFSVDIVYRWVKVALLVDTECGYIVNLFLKNV